jgi:hypothetical protein
MTTAFDYDLFVSHASEDKERFVRPLVEALTAEQLSVWYDETELHPGDRLIQSIERGLSRSRFGIIVISPAFLARRWPRSELDALTNREMATGESVLLPVWLDVDSETVREYSPLLADRIAIIGARGIAYSVSRIAEVVRPGRSPVVLSREILAGQGVATPPPSDPWWLDQIESAAELAGEGGWQDAMLWDRWSFPLPPKSDAPDERATRLAQAVLRNSWTHEANRRPITQITPPEVVFSLIDEMPGLCETCIEHPSFLGAYAPQLLIPGFGGQFEPMFDAWLDHAEKEGRRSDTVSLHLSSYADLDAALVTCTFFQGEHNGPSVKYYEHLDHFFWLLSDKSRWLPEYVRDTLIAGFGAWTVWLHRAVAFRRADPVEPLMAAVFTAGEQGRPFAMTDKARASLIEAAAESKVLLGLTEAPEELADRLAATGALEQYAASWRRDTQA